MFEPDKPAARAKAKVEEEHEVLVAFRGLAAELGVWLHAGSLSVALPDNDRLANRSFLIAPDGSIAARYTKIHMFDVQVGDGQVYQESASYKPGEEGVLAKTLGYIRADHLLRYSLSVSLSPSLRRAPRFCLLRPRLPR